MSSAEDFIDGSAYSPASQAPGGPACSAQQRSLQGTLSATLQLLQAVAADPGCPDDPQADAKAALAETSDFLSNLTELGRELLAERGLSTSIADTVEARLRSDPGTGRCGLAALRDRWRCLLTAEVKSAISRPKSPAPSSAMPSTAASSRLSAAAKSPAPSLADIVARRLLESGALVSEAEVAACGGDPVRARELAEAAARVRGIETEVAALRDAFPIDWDRQAGRLSFMAGRLGVLVVLDVGSERAIRLLSVSGQGLPAGCIPPPADAPLVKWLQCLDCEFHAPPTPEHPSLPLGP